VTEEREIKEIYKFRCSRRKELKIKIRRYINENRVRNVGGGRSN